ncbi:hypothetical protein BC351_24390 [Paenibacillus ferrarius]|uniref:Uncharacterized protein n=1 Tax=Paenibacillus ferrarius TaxID=1469647 RepID=A0A1V4HMK6_9BACL|nr:hypothetical protein [Paenibacillus ferrarius]OPH58088.1 hypothetical protein BC351_24390 [Paenibacillus ferrarius]
MKQSVRVKKRMILFEGCNRNMILKEFDLDLPYTGKNGKQDYDDNWKAKRIKFRDEVRCIASFYERVFEKKSIVDDYWKVLIECVDTITDSRVRNLLGVCTVQVELDIEEYFHLSNCEKKRIVLGLLKSGIEKIVEAKGWDYTPFDKAYNNIVMNNYTNTWIWKKPKKSPDKKYSAEVFCEHEVGSFDISIIIKSKNGNEMKRVKVKSDRPNEWAYAQNLGALDWVSSDEVVLVNKEQTEHWSISIAEIK